MNYTFDSLLAALGFVRVHDRGPAQDTTMAKPKMPRPPKKPRKGKY